jgi:hypothetical protein
MQQPSALQYRPLWIVGALALLLIVFLIVMAVQPKAARVAPLPEVARDTAAAAGSSAPLEMTPADAARRAAIAQLGFIKTPAEHVNAATYYLRARSLYAQLTDPEKQAIANWRTKLDPAAAAELSAKLLPIMQELHNARDADYTNFRDPETKVKPSDASQVNLMRNLTQAAQWDANYLFQSDPGIAIDDLESAETLDQNAAGVSTGFLAYSDLHSNALQIIAENIGDLPTGDDAGVIPLYDPDQYAETAQGIFQAQAAEFKSKVLTQFAGAIGETDDQYQQWYAQLAAHPSQIYGGQAALGVIQNQRATYIDSEIQNAMLAAGIAYQQGNQSEFQSVLDPATGTPFAVSGIAGAFQLISTYNFHGTPVRMSFGPGTAPGFPDP